MANKELFSSNLELVQACLAQDLVPLEPLDQDASKVETRCLRSNFLATVAKTTLKNGSWGHRCCKSLGDNLQNKLSNRIVDIRDPIPYNMSQRCPNCARTAMLDPSEEFARVCDFCNFESINFPKGGSLALYVSDTSWLVSVSNTKYAGGRYLALPEPAQSLAFYPLPRRSAKEFVAGIEHWILEAGGQRANWYEPSEWGASLDWLIPRTNTSFESLVDYVLEALANDSAFRLSQQRKRLPPKAGYVGVKSNGDEVKVEELPLPYVYYPGKKGFIFAFSKELGGAIYVCSCSKEMLSFDEAINAKAREYWNLNTSGEPLIMENICHACNKVLPTLMSSSYSHATFTFAWLNWYLKQEFFRAGFHDYPYLHVEQTTDKELLEILTQGRNNDPNSQNTMRRAVRSHLSNRVKNRFGLASLGGSSTSEVLLIQTVKTLLPGTSVVTHHRPVWLEGLELDIWIPSLRLGIEYQGQQHYVAVEQWGGELGLQDLQLRDKRKRDLCIQNDVKLIEIKYSDTITPELVKSLLGIL